MFFLEIVPSLLHNRNAPRPEANRTGQRRSRVGKLASRRKLKGAVAQHSRGDAGHDGLRLEMEVAKHLIGVPASDHTDAVAVDSGAEERHGTARTNGAGGDIGRRIRGIGVDNEGSANARCESPGSDVAEGPARGGRPERIELGRWRGGERAEGTDAFDETE